MIKDEDLSCSICDDLFTDPRVLPCGHSFCSACITQWRGQSRECPLCRGNIGPIELPKNVILAGLVDRFKEQMRSMNQCDKCDKTHANCKVYRNRSLCPQCMSKHLAKAHQQLSQKVADLTTSVSQLEAGIEPAMATQATWTQAQTGLAAVLDEVNQRAERVASTVNSQVEALTSAREVLNSLAAVAPTNASGLAKGIASANSLSDSLAKIVTDDEGNDVQLANEVTRLVEALSACLLAQNLGQAAVQVVTVQAKPRAPELPPLPRSISSLTVPAVATEVSISEYYSRFPQRCTNFFSVVGSVVALSVCWNTAGYRYGRGCVVSAQAADGGATVADREAFRPLPAEVLVMLEGVPPHTKVKMYDQNGAYKGNVNMCLPDGTPLPIPFGLAVNSHCQLIAVSVPKSNAVLVTYLDGSTKRYVTACSDRDLDHPLGVCISNQAVLYIADYRNHRVCSVNCHTGASVHVFEHNTLARIDRIAYCEQAGCLVVRNGDSHLVLLTLDQEGGFTRREIPHKFFHFFVDAFGGLVFTSGGAAESGQLRLISKPTAPGDSNVRQLLNWPEVKYSCLTGLRSGQVVAAAVNRKEVHIF